MVLSLLHPLSGIRPCSICVQHVILSRYASLWVYCTSFCRCSKFYWRWLYARYKCVCACCTWLGLRCTFLTCPCAYCPWFCPRYTSLSPISLFPDCAAHDLVNYCCFYNNYPQHDPRVSLNIKGVNFSPVINVHKTIRPTGWLYLLLKEAYHKLPRKPKDEN